MVCSNVFIAKRDADAVIGTDVEFALPRIVKRMKINADTANQRVEVAYLGLFAKRYAQYEEGRGCTLVSKDEAHDRTAFAASKVRRALAGRRERAIVRRQAFAGSAERSGTPGAWHARDCRHP